MAIVNSYVSLPEGKPSRSQSSPILFASIPVSPKKKSEVLLTDGDPEVTGDPDGFHWLMSGSIFMTTIGGPMSHQSANIAMESIV